jgi:hypothetical protein
MAGMWWQSDLTGPVKANIPAVDPLCSHFPKFFQRSSMQFAAQSINIYPTHTTAQ